MVVLDCLFNALDLKQEFNGVPLNTLALDLLNLLIPRGEKVDCSWFSDCQGRHLLDLLGKSFHHLLPKDDKRDKGPWKSIPTVTEMKRAGVRFEVGSTNGSFMHIKFKNGVMEIPPVVVQDQTETLLRNCIVAEQCSNGCITYMTSYASLMDSLNNSAEDVEVLRNQGIITNMLGNDAKVAALFNKLCCEVTMANYYYSDLCDKVNSYCKNRWRRAWRKLRDSLA
ncbi:hypothetical protein MKW92_044460 [Papaver armeniacum]|nr:hypothetical protein MKW92_044460 [Papaver armeniacum]